MSKVSTHSRPKAAGRHRRQTDQSRRRFNTQPPEGGWYVGGYGTGIADVSTHSRPKAAGTLIDILISGNVPFQHTAARRRLESILAHSRGFTGFQHTAARRRLGHRKAQRPDGMPFQHTAARRRLGMKSANVPAPRGFQHTAARRRLDEP